MIDLLFERRNYGLSGAAVFHRRSTNCQKPAKRHGNPRGDVLDICQPAGDLGDGSDA
jgi:hypothetical protein